jgi:putative ABC transport system permease protein
MDDTKMLRAKFTDAEICPAAYVVAKMTANGKTASVKVMGTDNTLKDIEEMSISEGRFLQLYDEQYARKVVVVGSDLAKDIFKSADVVGKKVSINNYIFEIVGVNDSSKEFHSPVRKQYGVYAVFKL